MFLRGSTSYHGTGKGVVDGVSGVVKRVVRQAVVSRRAVVNDARTFTKVAKDGVKTTTMIYVDESEIVGLTPSGSTSRLGKSGN